GRDDPAARCRPPAGDARAPGRREPLPASPDGRSARGPLAPGPLVLRAGRRASAVGPPRGRGVGCRRHRASIELEGRDAGAGIWILIAANVLLVVGERVSYNRFVSQKNLIRDAWANIDTELRRRYDLIPNLVETVKGYATHERDVFEEVTRARASAAGATGSPAAQAAAEGPFMAALGKLFAVAEAYPDLKANQNFLALQSELSNTEDRLQTARRFYNANVREFNTRL